MTNTENHVEKTIMFSTDLTARCDRPMERACRLAKDLPAKLVICHVLEHGQYGKEAVEAAKADIELHLASFEMEAEIIIQRGDVVNKIIETAESTGADLIVAGVARVGKLGDLVIGTPLERIIHHSPIPVLIVKNRAFTDYDLLVAATDFSPPSAHAIKQAAQIFTGLPIHIVNAFHVPFEGFLHSDKLTEEFRTEQYLQMVKFVEQLRLTGSGAPKVSHIIEYGSTSTVVLDEIKDLNSNLTVIGTHGTGGFRANMIGSMARSLIDYIPTDILAVRRKSK